MQLGRVVGQAVATIKHASLIGWRMPVVQPLSSTGQPDGEPIIVLDSLGAGVGQTVVLSSDGGGARELVQAKNSPARWLVLGICDD